MTDPVWESPDNSAPPPPSLNEFIQWGADRASMLRLDDAVSLTCVLQAALDTWADDPPDAQVIADFAGIARMMLDALGQPHTLESPVMPPLDRVLPIMQDRIAVIEEHRE